MSDEGKFVNTLLAVELLDDLEQVKAHHGIQSNSDAIRFLIRKEARAIRDKGTNGNGGRQPGN